MEQLVGLDQCCGLPSVLLGKDFACTETPRFDPIGYLDRVTFDLQAVQDRDILPLALSVKIRNDVGVYPIQLGVIRIDSLPCLPERIDQ
jgi:hypothetical protein